MRIRCWGSFVCTLNWKKIFARTKRRITGKLKIVPFVLALYTKKSKVPCEIKKKKMVNNNWYFNRFETCNQWFFCFFFKNEWLKKNSNHPVDRDYHVGPKYSSSRDIFQYTKKCIGIVFQSSLQKLVTTLRICHSNRRVLRYREPCLLTPFNDTPRGPLLFTSSST